jgi:hypothetical protein
LIKITDVTGHRSLEMLKIYSRDAEAFVGHAGECCEFELWGVIGWVRRLPPGQWRPPYSMIPPRP